MDHELPFATYRDFLTYLKELEANEDSRLDDQAMVWDMAAGEHKPTDFVEYNGEDELIEDGRLFLYTVTEI